MKYIISMILLLSIVFGVYAKENIVVSGIVGTSNHAPMILSVQPDSNPRILKTNRIQSYTIYFRDDEKDTLTYTITPLSGYTNPISGTIVPTDYDTQSGAYINFVYLAPATAHPNEKITITLNDGTPQNIIIKDLNLYIY